VAGKGIIHGLPVFDLGVAHLLAQASQLAYEDHQTVRRRARELGFPHVSFCDVDDTQSFVCANRETTVVAFRGTEADQLKDWTVDVDFDLVDGPLGGKVHVGFYDALSNVWRMVDDQVRTVCNDQTKYLWVTGHSLGAAMAALAVARWHECGRPVTGLYVFGQPRVGDRTFSINFDFDFKMATFRFVNRYDIVTRIPPRYLGYRHIGSFKYFNEDGQLVDDILWWRKFLSRWHGTIETVFDWCRHGVGDHGMSEYLRHVETAWRHQRLAEFRERTRRLHTNARSQPIQPPRRAA